MRSWQHSNPKSGVISLVDQSNDYLVQEHLLATKSGDEWSVLVKGMLAKNGGEYPPDWFEKVMASGVTAQCEKNWGDAVSSSYKIPAPNVNVPPGER